jgi:hypothetical protein
VVHGDEWRTITIRITIRITIKTTKDAPCS